jgi:opacity protein-like surface antigen
MKARGIIVAAALVAVGGAQAQLADAPAPHLRAEPVGRFGPLAAGFKRYEPLYGGNETANPNDRQFQGFRTDPRLVLGYAFNPYLAVETGYAHLRDEGFHKIDPGPVEAAVAAGALGVKSHTTYVAAKLTVPVNDRLTAYGKLGVAHSVVKDDGFVTPAQIARRAAGNTGSAFTSETSSGAYGAVGAKYKLDDRTTVKGEYRVNGSADKFGRGANASGLRGSIGIGF